MGVMRHRKVAAARNEAGTTRGVHMARAALASLGLAMLLAACGGGTTGDVDAAPPLTPTLPEMSGTVTDGVTVPSDLLLQVTVKGNVGTARTAEGRRDALLGNYLASLDQLSGPYLIRATGSDFEGTMSVATGAGTANVTSLTTLVTAQLLATDPFAYFDTLGGRGGFTGASDASIQAATARVRRLLARDYHFTVAAAVGDFVTTPFQPVAGDPMYDTLAALDATLAAAGTTYRALAVAIADEAARCRLESVTVTSGADVDPFCPYSKSNQAEEDDTSVYRVAFANQRGDVLTVRARGDVVLGAQFVTAEGVASSCEAAACRGIMLGAPAADLTRTVSFDGATLTSAGGPQVLQGSLQSAVPGLTLPGLPCTSNRYYLIHPDRSVEGYCALPDDYGLGAAGRSADSGATRRVYTFDGDNAGVAGPTIEVVTQGSTVLRVLLYRLDPDTGAATALYQCRDGGCAGVALGTVRIDESLGVPVSLQPIVFDDAVLSAVLPDGSLSTTDSVTLKASLTGFMVTDPSLPPLAPMACASGAPVVLAAISDQADPVVVCSPDDTQGFPLAGTYVDDDGLRVYYAQGLLTDDFGSFTPGNSVNVYLRRGAVVKVSFDAFGGPTYLCEGAACAGVAVSARSGAGERTVSFTGTLLQEMGTAGLPADRFATLDGSFVVPP